jgi:hypothetical protein
MSAVGASRFGSVEGRLTDPRSGAQPERRELALMPQSGPSSLALGTARHAPKHSFTAGHPLGQGDARVIRRVYREGSGAGANTGIEGRIEISWLQLGFQAQILAVLQLLNTEIPYAETQ